MALNIRDKNVKYSYNYQNLTNFDGNLPSNENFSAKLPSAELKADIGDKIVKYSYNYQNLTNFDGNLPSNENFSVKLPSAKLKAATIVIVVPLAIVHSEDSILVASCAFLLEFCGLSFSMPRVDIATLRRISSFYKSNDYNKHSEHLSPKGSAFLIVSHEGDIIVSLAQASVDDYLHNDIASTIKHKGYKK
ncbi:hypothetical protein NE237_013104 [Protea cynaroides]|uniref:Uncharacterized protein n=1 Tax=Protea cynaroides TaxID=273540 RepID=A0A9Q0H0C6_9MAGN|nr:hypothetical protein NE237_013104 [Protea cynaroides]